MTLQEAYALSAERQANLAYRKKIQRIKNTVLGVLAGSGLGAGVGFANNIASRADDVTLRGALAALLGGRKRNDRLAPALGASIGALAGGLGGYGLTRLKENYDESAGLDPTLANVMVTPYPGSIKTAAPIRAIGKYIPGSSYRNFAEWLRMARPVDQATVSTGVSRLEDAVMRGVGSKARKIVRGRQRRGLRPISAGNPLLPAGALDEAKRGAMAAAVKENRRLFMELRKMFSESGAFPEGARFSDIVSEYPPFRALTPVAV
jgi:hypothetical protein